MHFQKLNLFLNEPWNLDVFVYFCIMFIFIFFRITTVVYFSLDVSNMICVLNMDIITISVCGQFLQAGQTSGMDGAVSEDVYFMDRTFEGSSHSKPSRFPQKGPHNFRYASGVKAMCREFWSLCIFMRIPLIFITFGKCKIYVFLYARLLTGRIMV